MRRSIVPPYLLAHLAQLEDPALSHAAGAARRSLLFDPPVREFRATEPPRQWPPHILTPQPGLHRAVSDADSTESLPGRLVRSEGEGPTGDPAADEAYEGLGASYALFDEAFDRSSVDGQGLSLAGTVHFGRDYDNAFWDGSRMVFGDGDGQIFNRFTASLSVIGHELTHGVTHYTAGLVYQGQSGALNESVSDVFGAMVEQKVLGHSASDASWLIGVGLFTDEVEGNALRSLMHPGTAYDDDVLGKDPQPGHMDDYIDTLDDNGGVHLNSGIPNRAFALAATRLEGNAWDRAGQVWFDTLTGDLDMRIDFTGFAAATITAASRRYGDDSVEVSTIAEAWTEVGVATP